MTTPAEHAAALRALADWLTRMEFKADGHADAASAAADFLDNLEDWTTAYNDDVAHTIRRWVSPWEEA